jgi:molybdate transport system ATP-binding protein
MLEAVLRHRFRDFDLDVAFTVPAGITALFGRSGAGKTTVVKAIAGLIRCDEAQVRLEGKVLDEGAFHLPTHRRQIGYVFQEPRLFPHMTVRQNLTYSRRFHSTPGTPLEDVVGLLGLEQLLARRPATLSGGEKARVAIGRALMSSPRLLLLDEPLAALDETLKAEILPWLERLRDGARLPMIYVSHALPEVARLATSVVVLEAGRVRGAGPTEDILADPLLVSAMGLRDAGAVIKARLVGFEGDGLAVMETAAGQIYLPGVTAEVGQILRLRIPAQDVILSRERPIGLSALNILAAEAVSLTPVDGAAVLVALKLVDQQILARITVRSAKAMGLQAGTPCYAILKSMAIAGAV